MLTLNKILEVNKVANFKEIRKAYRKLSLKWHPDRWSGKSFEEQKQANEKMQELNNAYRILGDENLKKRYDLGETDPSDYDFDDLREKFKAEHEAETEKLEAKIKKMEELSEKLEERQKLLEEQWLLNAIYIEHFSTYNRISEAMCFTLPRVYVEDLDPTLWHPYKDWLDKVWDMPITIHKDRESGERSDELKQFKTEMIKAIKEAEIALKIREENQKKR